MCGVLFSVLMLCEAADEATSGGGELRNQGVQCIVLAILL